MWRSNTRLLFILAACPLAAQISVTCPAPGNLATVSVTDSTHPIIYIRIEPAPDGHTIPATFPAPGFDIATMQTAPVPSGATVTLATTPGKWLTYYFQNSPYIQGSAKPFDCIAGPPSNPTPTPSPTPTPGTPVVEPGAGMMLVGSVLGVDQAFVWVRRRDLTAAPVPGVTQCNDGDTWADDVNLCACVRKDTWKCLRWTQ
jgi:hypothetical protein